MPGDGSYKHMKWEYLNIDIVIGICACDFWLGLKIKKKEPKVTVIEDNGRAVGTFEI